MVVIFTAALNISMILSSTAVLGLKTGDKPAVFAVSDAFLAGVVDFDGVLRLLVLTSDSARYDPSIDSVPLLLDLIKNDLLMAWELEPVVAFLTLAGDFLLTFNFLGDGECSASSKVLYLAGVFPLGSLPLADFADFITELLAS